MPFLAALLKPRSVIDVGCGTAEWLAAFAEHGAAHIVGVDGDYVPRQMLKIPEESFLPYDLEEPLHIDKRFDLAVSLEVAEHLSPERGEAFVEELTALGETVLFSAAIPVQAEPIWGHVNERWQGYWAGLFEEQGYERVDCVRGRFWEDTRVPFWYRQNTILYVSTDSLRRNRKLLDECETHAGFPLSVAHPEMAPVSGGVVQWMLGEERKKRRQLRRKLQRIKGQA